MSDKTAIEWTDATWNPVTGCTKVSAGCKHCYAERDWARLSANPKTGYYGRQFTNVQCHLGVLTQPLHWKKPRRIFVNSMSDLFHPEVSSLFVADVFAIMAACPQHTFQVLTKRPEIARDLLGGASVLNFLASVEECMALYTDAPLAWPIPNVWLGVSVEDQVTADGRIPLLLETPAAVRWVSAEPLLGSVDLTNLRQPDGWWVDALKGFEQQIPHGTVDWVVVGGESGPRARPMHPDWARSLRDQCAAADVPFLFKQWGEWSPGRASLTAPLMKWREFVEGSTTARPVSLHGERAGQPVTLMVRAGKKSAGRLLDGVLHDDYPGVGSGETP